MMLRPGRMERWFRAGVGVSAIAVGVGAALVLSADPPDPGRPGDRGSTLVVDRNGRLLQELPPRGDGRSARWASMDRISPWIVAATIAAEDRRFRAHPGLDLRAAGRALLQNLKAGRIRSGASTLTMQLVRLLRGAERRPKRSLSVKLRQVRDALALELRLSKDKILERYLNLAPYGNGAVGVESASRRYFGCSAQEVSLAQAALLAALPQMPSVNNPRRRPRAVKRRRDRVLARMARQGVISAAQLAEARAEAAAVLPRSSPPFAAPHFVQYLKSRSPGAFPGWRGAARVVTTVDLDLQRDVESLVTQHLRSVNRRGRSMNNAAVIVLHSRSGQILAYVGSQGYGHPRGGAIDGARIRRHPGSALKPFIYAMAIERGYSSSTMLADIPLVFGPSSPRDGMYSPRNYDGKFHGPVRLREALASSRNIPAVRMVRRLGLDRVLARLRRLGLALPRPSTHYGVSIALGGGGVSLLNLTRAYATLARGGVDLAPRSVLRAETPLGARLDMPPSVRRRVIKKGAARVVTDILADPLARIRSFGARTPFSFSFDVAVKTGTSSGFKDNWSLGFSSDLTVGVWVGNVDGTTLGRTSGVIGAGPLFARVMRSARRRWRATGRGSRDQRLRRRGKLIVKRVCELSGQLPGKLCPHTVVERFLRGATPGGRCTVHRRAAVDRRNGLLATADCPARFVEHRPVLDLPPGFRKWARRRGLSLRPARHSPLCSGGADIPASVRITFPASGARFVIDPSRDGAAQSIPLDGVIRGPAARLTWLVDGAPVARVGPPYRARWVLKPGRHEVVAVAPGGVISKPVSFQVQ